ncbi:TPA: hypothetical protein MPX29_003015, partial [Listeria monocytogenes]|nr:hypothetical protein [Listeria monocytogenes]
SGDFNYNKLKTFVEWNIQKSGFNLNNSKTKILPKNKRQIVTGIVVNEKLQISKNERKKIRHELHYLKLDTNKHLSLRANNEKAQIKYLQQLLGKINYGLQINGKSKELLL